MQDSKKIVLVALAKATKKLRGSKSQYMLGAEYDIPSSVISDIERSVKDPQLTTIFKLANSFNLKPHEFLKEIEKELPSNFAILND